MLRLWLQPKTWLQGSQSSITGGSRCRKGQAWPICCWFAAIMPCVAGTPFGTPVLPEVKSSFTGAAGSTAAMARSSAASGTPSSSAVHGVAPGIGLSETTSIPAASGTARARAKGAPSSARINPGRSFAMMCRSLPRSLLCRL